MKILPFLILFLIGNIANLSAIHTDYSSLTDTIEPKKEIQEIQVIEQMPRFPGCEDIEGSDNDKKACADKKMLEYVYRNVKYPAIAKDKGVEGIAVISFVIEKDGSITDAKIRRDPGAGCGEEALRVIESMNDMPEKWIPGYQRGETVRVGFNFPIRFRLTQPKRPMTKKEKRRQRRAARKKKK